MTLLMQVSAPVVQLDITEALSVAISAAAKLGEEDQNYLAWRIMEEISEEQKWTESFARSQDLLQSMADEARAERVAAKPCLWKRYFEVADQPGISQKLRCAAAAN